MKKNKAKSSIVLAQRRMKVAELLAQGKTQLEMADELDVHRNTIFADLKAMGVELLKEVNKTTPSGTIIKFMASVDNVYKKLIKLYGEAETVNEKRLILKDIREASEQRIKVMQSLGLVKESTKKVEVSLQDQIVEDLLNDEKEKK